MTTIHKAQAAYLNALHDPQQVGKEKNARNALSPEAAQQLKKGARELEAQLLSSMLGEALVNGKPNRPFGGGAGEHQFGSMLRDEIGKAIASQKGVGVAAMIIRSLGQKP